MRLRRFALYVAVLITYSTPARARDAASWYAGPGAVERSTREHPGFNFEEGGVPPYGLPDLMGGAKTKQAWRWRRREILELFRVNVYGRSPGRPGDLRFRVFEESPRAMGGAATLKRVAVEISRAGRAHSFERVGRRRRRTQPAAVRGDGRGDQQGVPTLVRRSLQGLQRAGRRAAHRPAHAPRADGAACALRRQRRRRPLVRPAGRIPLAGTFVAGLRPLGRPARSRGRDAAARPAARPRAPRLSHTRGRARPDAVRLGALPGLRGRALAEVRAAGRSRQRAGTTCRLIVSARRLNAWRGVSATTPSARPRPSPQSRRPRPCRPPHPQSVQRETPLRRSACLLPTVVAEHALDVMRHHAGQRLVIQ